MEEIIASLILIFIVSIIENIRKGKNIKKLRESWVLCKRVSDLERSFLTEKQLQELELLKKDDDVLKMIFNDMHKTKEKIDNYAKALPEYLDLYSSISSVEK